jgi:lysophospholipid acyltransferase (LPLAT)-like uncharacterized protein
MKFSNAALGWLIAIAILILRACCRIRLHNDPRPKLRARSQSYVYSVLHAHQIAAIIDGEPGTGAMVSRSADGELLIPSLRVCGIVPIRGSNRRKNGDKGGLAAIDALVEHIVGGVPGYVAVDGPRGPRNRVHKGIALLSQRTGAAVVNMVAVPTRRWIFTRAWDRFQIPKPFATLNGYFGKPLFPRKGESVEQYRKRIETALSELEQKHDPAEAELAGVATRKRVGLPMSVNVVHLKAGMKQTVSTAGEDGADVVLGRR